MATRSFSLAYINILTVLYCFIFRLFLAVIAISI